MKGPLVPLVMIPRFTSYVGAGTFDTAPLDVERYARFVLRVWRGTALGTSPAVTIRFQASHDGITWFDLATVSGFNAEGTVDEAIAWRWLRARVELTGTDPAFSCWAAGVLEERIA